MRAVLFRGPPKESRVLMAARALPGITIGGFWALATATIVRFFREGFVPGWLGLQQTAVSKAERRRDDDPEC